MAVLMCLAVASVQADELERQLADAIALAPGADALDRPARIDPVLAAYAKAGLVGSKPDFRLVYDDYYVLRKPAKFLGHLLAAIEVENMQAFVGCCVDEGVILLLRSNGGDDDLAEFAERSACSVPGYLDQALGRNPQHTARRFPKADYVTLSCRVHDAQGR
jgi:hypothetical protein